MSHVPNWGRASSKALRWKHAWRVQGTKGRSVVWNAEDEGIREVRKVTRGDRLGRIFAIRKTLEKWKWSSWQKQARGYLLTPTHHFS